MKTLKAPVNKDKAHMVEFKLLVSDLTEMKDAQKEIMTSVNSIDKNVAIIQEHLRGLNGQVGRNSTEIKELQTQAISTKVQLARFIATGGISGGAVGILFFAVAKMAGF